MVTMLCGGIQDNFTRTMLIQYIYKENECNNTHRFEIMLW